MTIPHSADPFRHHPSLRRVIIDPLKSALRTFKPEDFDEQTKAIGAFHVNRYTNAQIEQSRQSFLAGHWDEDLWIFGYGSLMWNPAVRFVEVRRAISRSHVRRFCLMDTLGGRGTPDKPGLMVALDERMPNDPKYCEGLAFRIPKKRLAEETPILWNREMVAPAYQPAWIHLETDLGVVPALGFVADHSAHMITSDLCHTDQVKYAATGAGRLGTSFEYLANIAAHFDAIRIDDEEVSKLLLDAAAYRADNNVD